MASSSPSSTCSPTLTSTQTPMILLSNISNLVSVKLDHSNYVLWKYQITSILKAYSVLSFVDGTQQCPPEYLQNSNGSLQENSLYQQWISRDQGLLTLINSTLSPTALSLVVGQTTAHGVWSILEKRYTSSSRSNILNLKMELHNIKKESTDSINSFLQKIKDTRDRLGAVGVEIDNEEILHIVLKGLPHEYHAFGTAIRTRNDATSFEDIHVLLTAEEQSLQSTIELSKEHAHMAMLANANRNNTLFSSQGNRGRGRNSFNRGRGRNFHNNSGRGGYNNAGNNSSGNAGSPGGFNNHYNSSPTQSYNQRPACQICGKNGHAALDCYHRMDYSYQGKQPPSKLAAMAATSNSQHSDQSYWISDTGATDHFTPDLSTIPDHQEYTGTDLATVGNGQAIPITHIGNSQLKASSHLFHLRKVLRVPSMASNLLSVNKFCHDNNCCFLFDANQFKIKDMPTGKLLYRGPSKNGLYPIDGVSLPPPCHTSNFSSKSVSSKVWHDRLGHPNSQVQQRIFSNSPVHNSSSNKTESACTHCIQEKMTHFPFHKSVSKACKPLEIIHSDVWGPSPITSVGGTRFYVIFVDEFTRFTWFYPIRNKSQVLSCFVSFSNTMQNLLNHKIKILRTDCGGEYASNEFHSFCISHGITHQYTCPHTSQQNGLAERKHRHIVDIALTLISQSSLPLSFWPYAFSTAVYLINRVPPSNSKTSSPWELLFHRQPNYASLRTFGCLCYPLMRPYNSHKLQPRSVECVFLGYATNAKGYLCYNIHTRKYYTSRHVIFTESVFPFHKSSFVQTPIPPTWLNTNLSFHTCPLTPILGSGPVVSSPPSILGPHPSLSSIPILDPPSDISPTLSSNPPHLPPATSVTNPHSSTHPMQTRAKSGIFKPKLFHHTLVNDYLTTEPPTYKIASQLPQWQDAMTSEFQALQRQNTWTLVPSSSNQNLVGCRWVYKLKRNSDGSIARYKARLVAKGYHQQQGMDYDETFSPVVKPATVRLILSIAAQQNWSLKQLDVSNAFLHGLLKENVYMQQPPGFIDPQYPKHVCQLQKALYGLKQAPRAWFERFTSHLLTMGFTPSLADPSLFLYRQGSTVVYLLLYVDDIIVTGNQPTAVQSLITKLAQEFDIKDLGQLKFFLGLQIDYRSSGFFVHQHKYATDLLAKFNMSTCKPCSTPFVSLSRIRKDDGIPLSDPTPFRSMVGGLQYLTFTRPDLSYAVNHICQFMHQPTDHHLVAAKRILRYVQGTLHHGLTFCPGPLSLTAFTDSDWAGDPMDRRSTTGLIVFLGHNPITWQSKKQPTVARSSTEAEYRALANCAADLAWVRMVLKDLGIFLHAPPTIWCDNLSALALATNPVFHARTKHVEVDYHFIREKVTNRDLQLHHISTDDQLADILTKALPSPRFRYLQDKLMPHSTSHQFEGG